jgi:hypothetical protein
MQHPKYTTYINYFVHFHKLLKYIVHTHKKKQFVLGEYPYECIVQLKAHLRFNVFLLLILIAHNIHTIL